MFFRRWLPGLGCLALAMGAVMAQEAAMTFPVKPSETIPLWPHEVPGAYQPYLKTYLIDDPAPRGLVVIFPGGGYEFVHEAIDGTVFNRMGLHAVAVFYRVDPSRYPIPQQDAFRALRLVKSLAPGWGVTPGRIAAAGISAGGHVAASVGTLLDDPECAAPLVGDAVDRQDPRPDALVLCVPVLTSGEFGNQPSFDHLLGEKSTPDLRRALSLETRVTPRTPPTFLWGTASDDVVPIESSLLFALALRRAGVPVELHVFPRGWHGSYDEPDYAPTTAWQSLCATWLGELGFFPEATSR